MIQSEYRIRDLAWTIGFDRPRVTWRRYGLRGEHRRPMFHRFDVKGGVTPLDVFAENVVRHNPLFDRLVRKGRI